MIDDAIAVYMDAIPGYEIIEILSNEYKTVTGNINYEKYNFKL